MILIPAALGAASYPPTRTASQGDDFFGTKVADTYRWLEDLDSAETAGWVDAQNKVTFDFPAKLGRRDAIEQRLTELYNYPRHDLPFKEGGRYFHTYNTGLKHQPQLIVQTRSRAAGGEPGCEISGVYPHRRKGRARGGGNRWPNRSRKSPASWPSRCISRARGRIKGGGPSSARACAAGRPPAGPAAGSTCERRTNRASSCPCVAKAPPARHKLPAPTVRLVCKVAFGVGALLS